MKSIVWNLKCIVRGKMWKMESIVHYIKSILAPLKFDIGKNSICIAFFPLVLKVLLFLRLMTYLVRQSYCHYFCCLAVCCLCLEHSLINLPLTDLP